MDTLDPKALTALRELLLERGRASLVPPLTTLPPLGEPAALTEDQRALIERVAPISELLYLMMSVDGECDAGERKMLRGAVRALTAGNLRTAQIDPMLTEFEAQRAQYGTAERLQSVAARLQVDRAEAEAAYSLAAAMALANAQLDVRERELLDELGDLLGLSAKRRAELTQAPQP